MVFPTLGVCVYICIDYKRLIIYSFIQTIILIENKLMFDILFYFVLVLFCFALQQMAKPEMVPGKLLRNY